MTRFLLNIPDGSILTSDEAKFIEKYYVKQGEWITTTHSQKCSNCGHEIEPRLFGAYMRYCCVCGSDNRKAVTHDTKR